MLILNLLATDRGEEGRSRFLRMQYWMKLVFCLLTIHWSDSKFQVCSNRLIWVYTSFLEDIASAIESAFVFRSATLLAPRSNLEVKPKLLGEIVQPLFDSKTTWCLMTTHYALCFILQSWPEPRLESLVLSTSRVTWTRGTLGSNACSYLANICFYSSRPFGEFHWFKIDVGSGEMHEILAHPRHHYAMPAETF